MTRRYPDPILIQPCEAEPPFWPSGARNTGTDYPAPDETNTGTGSYLFAGY